MKIMKKAIYVVMALFCLNLAICAQSITLKKSDITVKQAMDELKNESGYSFVFSSVDIDTQKKISVWIENKNVEEAIKQILQGQEVSFEVKGKNIILKKATASKKAQPEQKSKVTGVVLDAHGEPIIGANVVEKGTTNGTITDLDGHYSLEVSSSRSILHISYIGYNTQDVSVAGKSELTTSLLEDSQTLEEVVVVGYGVQKRASITGSVASLQAKDIATVKTANVTNALAGKLPGLRAVQRSGAPGDDAASVDIRGFGNALVIVDGIERDFTQLDANDIESISILKDASAAIRF